MSFAATLSTVSSIFSAIVVYGTGTALSNASAPASAVSSPQAACVAIATAAFLVQRVLFMSLAEGVPDVNCTVINATSYSCLLFMRCTILAGLWLRASAVTRTLASSLAVAVTVAAVGLGGASLVILVFQAVRSPLVPGTCLQVLDQRLTTTTNMLFVVALSALTAVMSIPIFRALANADAALAYSAATTAAAAAQPPFSSQIPGSVALASSSPLVVGPSQLHQKARTLSMHVRLIPLLLCVCLAAISAASSSVQTPLLFLTTLVFSDFCQLWILLFPLVVLAAGHDVQPTAAAAAAAAKYPYPHMASYGGHGGHAIVVAPPMTHANGLAPVPVAHGSQTEHTSPRMW